MEKNKKLKRSLSSGFTFGSFQTGSCHLSSIEFRLSIKLRMPGRFPFIHYTFFFLFSRLIFLFFLLNFSNRFFISMSLKQRIYRVLELFDKLFYFCYNLVGKNLKKFFEICEFTGYLRDLGKNGKMLKNPKSNGSVIINR